MAINLTAIVVRHERRVRLVFDASLAMSAFTSTSYYSALNLDGGAASPTIAKALVVTSSPNVVELQLGLDLVQGGKYSFTASGVPAVDLSTSPTQTVTATVGTEPTPAALGTHGGISNLERELYGVDLLVMDDFIEGPDGDLATVAGLRCATLDLQEAMLADGLPWDPAYGLHARQEVDGAPGALVTLRGRAIEIMRRDDRILSADAEVDTTDPEGPVLTVKPTWIGALGTPQQPVRVPLLGDR
jgi:hypothetical protein